MQQNEKRRFPRIACEIDSSFRRVAAGPDLVEETTVQDLSEGGVRFGSNHFIAVHDRLLVRLRIPHQRPVEAVVEPAWIREVPSVNRYDIGAKFLSLSDSDRDILRRFTQPTQYF